MSLTLVFRLENPRKRNIWCIMQYPWDNTLDRFYHRSCVLCLNSQISQKEVSQRQSLMEKKSSHVLRSLTSFFLFSCVESNSILNFYSESKKKMLNILSCKQLYSQLSWSHCFELLKHWNRETHKFHKFFRPKLLYFLL